MVVRQRRDHLPWPPYPATSGSPIGVVCRPIRALDVFISISRFYGGRCQYICPFQRFMWLF